METPSQPHPPTPPGGVVHTYQKFDPLNFPPPAGEPPDLSSAAMEHMLTYGSMRDLTDEELANAIRLDPSMFPKLGPSLDALAAMLRERKRKILETYETDSARKDADRAYKEHAGEIEAPKQFRHDFDRAVREEQIADLERLWYKQKREDSDFAKDLVSLMESLGVKYQIDELASKYTFTGREELTADEALEIKQELEAIDKLLEQLEEASKNAQLAIIDMSQLSEQLEEMLGSEDARERLEEINQLQQQIEDYVREQAKAQGLEHTRQGYQLSPQAFRVFQRKLLSRIFSDLQAARSGRHSGPILGDGAVETQKTKDYEFGDSAAHLDITQTILNAASRHGNATVRERSSSSSDQAGSHGSESRTLPDGRVSVRPTIDDLTIHLTKNNPKCATMVLLDMSGSMRYNGQYINCKRMALGLDGLIRSEYPGDFLGFVEMYTFAKRRPIGDIPTLMPKPVTIHQSVVRLKADMSNPAISEMQVPHHFTNIQHALQISRQTLAVQDTPNRQIILITDGLPTAHYEGKDLFLLYPPDPRTEEATMREAMLCKRENITINIFLLPSWSQSSEDIQFAHRLAETTKGRVFFTGGKDLDRFVLWDYVSNRRAILG
jgi:uncharacterized protein with von Willebrand factor type A (vWA) domain